MRQWTGLAFERGAASEASPAVATRRIEAIARDADPAPVIEAAIAETRERAAAGGSHSTALAIDTRALELVHFTLWASRAPADETTYEVLHLSSPELERIEVATW